MTARFTEKLDALPRTLALLADFDASRLGDAIRLGRDRHTIAIGSGGSAISAEFLARCRETLGCGPTSVETPMQFSLGAADISDSDVWLFSAGADNPDVTAAVLAARSRCRRPPCIVTRNPDGQAAREVAAAGGVVHAVPVADPKDGYLTTHSLVATVGALLLAADRASDDEVGTGLLDEFVARSVDALSPEIRARTRHIADTLDRQDTLIVMADPQVRPVVTLIETSVWEAGICTVQSTDFRNFAHGRHTWLHHRGDRSMLLALTGRESRATWNALETVLPQSQRRVVVDLGDCGRFSNAVGIVEGLALIEAMGEAVGIDPAKPGIGIFGRAMYEDPSLREIVAKLPAAIRQKRAAVLRRDDPNQAGVSLSAIEEQRLHALGEASFGGIVLDYDGTIVRTEDRYSPPNAEIAGELERLHRAGLRIGIATGRGSSAGRDLRTILDPSIHRDVLMGYYNGGYMQTLDVDTKTRRPQADPGIDEVIAWMEGRPDLFRGFERPEPGVQITLQMDNLTHPERFSIDARECPAVRDGRVRIVRSAHSLDIVVSRATKMNVVHIIAEGLSDGRAVLCIGDSGSRQGNDNALLSNLYGISVGEVCSTPNGCWSLFGDHITGPDALLKVLRALVLRDVSEIRLNVAALALDRR